MKDERGRKIVTKFETTVTKTYVYRVRKDDHEIVDSEFIRAKETKKSVSKELTFNGFEKCVHDIKNTPSTKG